MEILYWWLISLPAFFALGWLAARIDIREILREAKALPRAFATSYRHVVEENPEEALKPFLDFHIPENVSFDLLLSLGVLYRRQGYFIEAIRLHETLRQRIDLSESEINEVTWELSQDYLKAGMLERAIMCIQAINAPEMDLRVTLTMLEIFQIQRQWDKALEYTSKIALISNINEKRQRSHFHCELAIKAFQRLDTNAMEHHLQAAEHENAHNVRILILRGEFAAANQDYEKAIEYWKTIENIDSLFLIQVIGKIHEAFAVLKQPDEEQRLLQGYFENAPSAPLLYEIEQALGSRLKAKKIFSWIHQFEQLLQSWQTFQIALRAMEKLPFASSQTLEDIPCSEYIKQLQKCAAFTRPRHFGYICDHCGFLLPNYVWRCPGCGNWESYSPIPRSAA